MPSKKSSDIVKLSLALFNIGFWIGLLIWIIIDSGEMIPLLKSLGITVLVVGGFVIILISTIWSIDQVVTWFSRNEEGE